MKLILHFAIFLFLFYNLSIGQELSDFHVESRTKADMVFTKIMEGQKKKDAPYILLASGNSHYVIVQDRFSHYTFIQAELSSGEKIAINKVTTEVKPNKLLKRAFDFSIYHRGFISFSSEFYNNGYDIGSGAPTYFVVKDENGVRYGESVLSVFVKPNPIDAEVYAFLINKLIEQN